MTATERSSSVDATKQDSFAEIYEWSAGYVKRHPLASLAPVGDQFVLGNARQGRLLQLTDLITSDLSAIASLGQPYIETALNQARPPHNPATYPFTADRWTPDKVYSGAYKAWALTPEELILYMPEYPVARDTPTNYTPGIMQWSMDGGTVQARIPLTALSPVLRPEYRPG